ncbi:uncharacterized protein N7459_007770 [Penicillium hispanicum]|uniref:uncharacterized protein n=1 Tax=Penicillium hispanicum TaxID=1080232 RepID=UPI0025400FBC|nr:uncharacterized protein N7459_007770 [Penicillium hispanicum]KAJ5578806.1 hypothetical protein N7459_007770 [Penicillium hispanicum]
MAKCESYKGPIFDVQAHAILPSSYSTVAAGIRKNVNLEQGTAETIADDICVQLADDLEGDFRRKSLGQNGIQVVTINAFFPSLPADLIGIASIPPAPILATAGVAADGHSYTQKALSGLHRAITDLGLKGIMFASNYNGIFLGDAVYDPYFALAEELNVPVIIHPAVEPVETPFVSRKNIPTYSGFLNDQRTTLLDLILSGVYEKFPNITIIATHLGGGILTSLGRFRALSKRFPHGTFFIDQSGQKKLLPKPVHEYIAKIYFDCNNADMADIQHAASVVAHTHLLSGTDFPWTDDTYTREVLGLVDPSIRSDIAYNNAAKLFHFPAFGSP